MHVRQFMNGSHAYLHTVVLSSTSTRTSTQNQMFSSTCKMQDYYNPYLKPIFNVDGSRTSMYVHCTVLYVGTVVGSSI